jgi:hypothetical protein
MATALILYGTEGCHLCDEAEALLRQAGLHWESVDIAEDDALLARYGTRIPVLSGANGNELDWPFQQRDLARFIA